MYLLRNNNAARYFSIFCFSFFLIIFSLVLVNNLGYISFLPAFLIIALVYIAAYANVGIGVVLSYVLFYIYGSLTAVNPAVVAFSGIVSYAVAYILWKKIAIDNVLVEILVTFFSFAVFDIVLFMSVFYGLGVGFSYTDFFTGFYLPSSVSTALISPVIFPVFKKLGFAKFPWKGALFLD